MGTKDSKQVLLESQHYRDFVFARPPIGRPLPIPLTTMMWVVDTHTQISDVRRVTYI